MKALIVGASGELGQVVANRLAEDGYYLVLHGNERVGVLHKLAEGLGVARVVQADLRRPDEIVSLIDQAIADDDRLDVVVYAAGINPTADPVESLELDDWNAILSVNLTGAFLVLKRALPFLRRQRGRAVIVSSIFGMETPANRAAYGASKHGLVGLTQSLAREEREVRINAVCPGPMWTESLKRIFQDHAMKAGVTFDDYVRQREQRIPAGRFLTLNECAAVIAFLASPTETFLTGEAIRISGGSVI